MPPLPDEVLLDIFHHLCRWDLDATSLSCNRFQSAITKRMTGVCLRRLRQAKITKTGTFIVTERDPNRLELTRPEELPRYMRQTYVGYLGLSFPPLKSAAFDEVMAGLEENASTIAVYKLYFEEGDFSRLEFGRITALCKSLSSLSHLQFNE